MIHTAAAVSTASFAAATLAPAALAAAARRAAAPPSAHALPPSRAAGLALASGTRIERRRVPGGEEDPAIPRGQALRLALLHIFTGLGQDLLLAPPAVGVVRPPEVF